MEPREGSGTCAILFTDLVDSTALRARLGEEAADRWIIEAEGRARDLVQARRGRVVKGTGDGVLAAFDSAADALAAAVAFQQRAEYPMRIGVSIGDVTWRQGDWLATAVPRGGPRPEPLGGAPSPCDLHVIRGLGRGSVPRVGLGRSRPPSYLPDCLPGTPRVVSRSMWKIRERSPVPEIGKSNPSTIHSPLL